MREMSFSQLWPKLAQDKFTTFRLPRRDKDWEVGEQVRIMFKGRTKMRSILGSAKIIGKAPRAVPLAFRWVDLNNVRQTEVPPVTVAEARQDGFGSVKDMAIWVTLKHRTVKDDVLVMNRLVLEWNCVQFYIDQHDQVAEAWADLNMGTGKNIIKGEQSAFMLAHVLNTS